MTVYVVTCRWTVRFPDATMVAAVFRDEADALRYVNEQSAMAANKDAKFVVWGRELQ